MSDVKMCDGCLRKIEPGTRSITQEMEGRETPVDLCKDCIPHFEAYKRAMLSTLERCKAMEDEECRRLTSQFWQEVNRRGRETAEGSA